MSHQYDCESYCHFGTHSNAVCLQEMFAIKLKRVFFKDQSHEFTQMYSWDRLFWLIMLFVILVDNIDSLFLGDVSVEWTHLVKLELRYLTKIHKHTPVGRTIVSGSCLRSKRSRTKRSKFWPRALVFLHSGRAKNGARAKRWKEGGGGGGRRERLPANPSILKNPFAHERGSWLVRHGHLDWQVYHVRLNDCSNNSCVTRICHQRKLF